MRNFRISGLAKATDTSAATIRYYEQVELMPAPRRAASGHRYYDDADVKRLAYVRRCRALGFSLKEIRTFVQVAAGEHEEGTCRSIVVNRLEEVRLRVQELQKVESRLQTILSPQQSNSRCSAVALLA